MVTAALALVACYTARADEQTYQGRGLVCDTEAQLKKAIAAYDNGENGVEAVNKDEPRACGILIVAYRKKETVGTVTTKQGTLDIVRIEIVAIHDGTMWRPVANVAQLTAMPQKDDDKPPNAKPSAVIQF